MNSKELIGGALIGVAIFIAAKSWPGEGEGAEEQYQMAARHGLSAREDCSRTGEVAAAYLRDGDEQQYSHWREMQRLTCLRADICQSIAGGCPGDAP